MALAPAIIRWGDDASSDVLRGRARCGKCGSKGATLQTPELGRFAGRPGAVPDAVTLQPGACGITNAPDHLR